MKLLKVNQVRNELRGRGKRAESKLKKRGLLPEPPKDASP
jgi:hypothetical protein